MTTKFKRAASGGVAALMLAILGFSTMAGAQNTNNVANGFRVSPVRSEITIEKGKGTTVTITVENPTNIPTVAKPIVNDFVASDDESGTPRLILDDSVPSPKNSFKTLVGPIDDIKLDAKQKKDIDVRISVPANAGAGGYYGAVRFSPAEVGQVSNVGLTASVGTIFLITVPGELKEKADLLEMSAAQKGKLKSFITSGDVSVVTRLKNSGDIHIKPFGKVQIKNMFGKVVGEFELNNTDPRSNILPDATRKFENSIAKPGKGWFGRYTITGNIAYSQGSGQIITAKATFWYMPVWAIAVLVVLLLAIVGGIYFLVRKFTGGSHRSKR